MAKKSKPKKKAAKPAAKKKAAKKTPAKKKAAAKKPAKKAAPKKPAKKAAKKAAPKKPAKKVAKKAAPKKAAKPAKAKKEAKKPVAKSKPVAAPKTISKQEKKALLKQAAGKVSKKQATAEYEESDDKKKTREFEPIFEYRPQTRPKPLGSQPKPFIGKDTRTRYSDDELQEFKEIILKKLEEAQKDYELLKSTLSHKDDHGTDDTSPTFKLLEDGSDVMSKEETAQLASRQEKFIQALQNALIRIENKTYGICRVTGKLIPKERLRSVPHATLSIDAKLEQY
jgi:RNA polymerase-binding transcription factor DksA